MSADSEIVVKLDQVARVYRQDSQAVRTPDGIDLKIRSGDFAVLVGPSGSGKTTLLNLIGGVDSPTTGRIWIAGTETSRMSRRQLSEMRLRKIGFVLQEFNLIPVLSALENVEFVMLLQGRPEAQRQARAMDLLKELGLQGLEHRRPAELSGGQQQSVAVARAIAAEPVIAGIASLLSADAAGKEILHPVAVVIFGGLVSSTLLDTLLTPLLYLRFGRGRRSGCWQCLRRIGPPGFHRKRSDCTRFVAMVDPCEMPGQGRCLESASAPRP